MEKGWTVDVAAKEVMEWIRGGCTLPFLVADEEKDLTAKYIGTFTKNLENEIAWGKAKDKVLPLAYMVGALATLFAAADQALTGTLGKPVRVFTQHTSRAAYLISKVCTYSDTGSLTPGAICPDLAFGGEEGDPVENAKIIPLLRSIFESLKLV